MKRLLALFAVLLLGAGLAACGDDDDDDAAAETTTTTAEPAEETTTTTGAPEPAGDGAQVAVAETSLGAVLVNADGMTLYLFEPDTEAATACADACAQAWPPLFAEGEPAAGDGADAALLGTAARDDGGDQVTYNGHRLYTYSGDTAAGDVTGQGVGDVWFAVTPAGEAAG
jgi:predicted lipoprotein with Yx(FWY)xxD motif